MSSDRNLGNGSLLGVVVKRHRLLALACGVGLIGVLAACQNYGQPKSVADASEAIPAHPDYNWDVRPILSQNCFQCHGNDPGHRKAGLRLDVADAAYGKLPENPSKRAVVPGNPRRSELFKRITSTDADYRMPPKDAHKTVSARDIAVLERWIKQGAKYKNHWAYLPIKEVKPARTEWDKQAVNAVDRYIFAKLKDKGLSPSAEADKETLINRVTMDLTGLPPTLAEVDAFLADKRANAYEIVVDRLLSSTAYAERQTNIWMDVARYADTGGGLNDSESAMQFPYRDWVISAFKRNIPYDRFVTWQLAGDQLPNATREQILATAFIRAGKKNTEGGAIDEDFRLEYVLERTELVGKAFLGLTVACAKCHDHKYDVISQSDYYSMAGFFNQIDQYGRGAGPTLAWPTPTQARNLAAAQKTTASRWTAYQAALTVARQQAAGEIDRLPAVQRPAFIKAAIDADTQAYYPLDSGYKGDLTPVIIDAAPRGKGVPKDGDLDASNRTRAQAQTDLKPKILAARAQYDALKAAGKPIPEEIQKIIAPTGAGQRVRQTVGEDGDKGKAGGKVVKAAMKAAPKPAAMKPAAVAAPRDKDLPRIAAKEIDQALDELIAVGYTDDRLGSGSNVKKRGLIPGLKADLFLWSPSGMPGQKPAGLNNAKFVPGARGQGVQMRDTVIMSDQEVGKFERFQPFTLDLWVKLRAKDYEDITRPGLTDAVIFYNSGGTDGRGYELVLSDGKLVFNITNDAPQNQIKVSAAKALPRQSWQHITVTYDGNSKAEGVRMYLNGQPTEQQTLRNTLTRSSFPRGVHNYLGGYFGLQAGASFNRPELVEGAVDEIRVVTRALTPAEVAELQGPAALAKIAPADLRAQLIDIKAAKSPAVVEAWKALTDARAAEQRVETPIQRLYVAGDAPVPRPNHILDRGVYNSYKGEVQAHALPRVYKWDAKLPKNRLGLSQWLFDPKNPMTSRVFVNRMWQSHFGTGIVETVEDFGTQGSNPTHPELLDYLSAEFIRSGWDIKHMHKLMVTSATYRQSSTITPDRLEKDPRNFLLARGPRYRLSAEQLRDTALFASGLLNVKVGGDAVFPYQPEAIWDGAGVGVAVYPFDVPQDQMHRRSMYTFVRRNAPTANLVVFDQPDRNVAAVARPMSNTPLQSLVLLNDPQFNEAYRKLAERVMKQTSSPDQQLVTLFRLSARRPPSQRELTHLREFRASEMAITTKSPAETERMLAGGRAKSDPSLNRAELAAMSVVVAGMMNSPDAYTLR